VVAFAGVQVLDVRNFRVEELVNIVRDVFEHEADVVAAEEVWDDDVVGSLLI